MASQEHSHVGDAADVSQNAEAAHYVVTAHPPGGVLLSTKCNFTGPDSTCHRNAAPSMQCVPLFRTPSSGVSRHESCHRGS
eukprot:scaffold34265_cov58-Attheya_sp.AAC.6